MEFEHTKNLTLSLTVVAKYMVAHARYIDASFHQDRRFSVQEGRCKHHIKAFMGETCCTETEPAILS